MVTDCSHSIDPSCADGIDADAIAVFISDNCGQAGTWHVKVFAAPEGHIDHPSAVVEPVPDGKVYIAYTATDLLPHRSFVVTFDALTENFGTPTELPGPAGEDKFPQLAMIGTPSAGGTLFAVWAHVDDHPVGLYKITWYIAWSVDGNGSWKSPHAIMKGEVPETVGAAATRNSANPRFLIGANHHCIVALPTRPTGDPHIPSDDAQHIVVRETADGIHWNWGYVSPTSKLGSGHDAFNPVLVRNTYDATDARVLLSWLDTGDDPGGSKWMPRAISSGADATAGSWDGSPLPLRSSPFDTPDMSRGYFLGDYNGAAVVWPNQDPDPPYLTAWAATESGVGTVIQGALVRPTP